MPKFIASASHELVIAKGKIEELTDENLKLKARVLLLETHVRTHNIPLPKSGSSRRTTSSVALDKGFLKPTTASLNRSIQGAPQEVQQAPKTPATIYSKYRDRKFQYHDGALVEIYAAHYQRQTESSFWKKSDRFFEYKTKKDTSNTQSNEDTWSYTSWNTSCYTVDSSWKKTGIDDESPAQAAKRSLIERSRLEDDVKGNLDWTPIRSYLLLSHLRRTLRLAQEIFFYGTKKYLPEAANLLQGPHEVQWGRDEMRHRFFRKIELNG
ncbi:hypothetical protein K449DRAFT_398908 [Hypoxylon sp. EC38]|nr:hypothetical protein K449DRAFT_398908 [Hypoxylon sp. EC38]